MRDSRFFATAFAAALASLLGLGPGAAADLAAAPESYQARDADSAPLPVWLVRYKLRQAGYHDIADVRPVVNGVAQGAAHGFAVLAQDRWGRRVKLYVDGASGAVRPQEGYGLAPLRREEVAEHLAALGYDCLAPAIACADRYEVLARDAERGEVRLNIDPVSGAVWHARS